MNYRTVECSDRLPEECTEVVVSSNGLFDTGFYQEGQWYIGPNERAVIIGPDFWLEPYELPTEEEIRIIIYDHAYPAEWKDKTPFEKTRFGEDTAKAITNLLKGEKQ